MASCPNKNDPTWKQIVEEHGELVAIDAYIENNYQIPDSLESVVPQDSTMWESERETKAEGFRSVMETHSKIQNALASKLSTYEGSSDDKFMKGLRKLIEDFAKADNVKGSILFIQNAEKMLDLLEPKLDTVKDNLELLKQSSDFASTYELMGEISDLLTAVGGPATMKKRVNAVKERVEAFDIKYKQYAKNTLVNRMGAESTIMRHRRKTELGRKYTADNPKRSSPLSEKEYKAAKDKYVENALNEQRDEILRLEKRYVKELLTIAPRDISAITKSLIDPRGVNDHMIQLAVKLLDRADFNAKEDFNVDRTKSIKVWEEFTKGLKGTAITNQKELYKDIYEEKDGKATGYYTRRFYSDYYKSKAVMEAEFGAMSDAWHSENINLTKDEKKALPLEEKPHLIFRKAWSEEHLITPEFGIEDNNIKPEFKNPSYDTLQGDPRKKGMYDYLVEFNKGSDDMLTSRGKLRWKLPSITKKDSELLTDRGLLGTLKTKWGDTTKIKVDDLDSGELLIEDDVVRVLTDEKGRALKRISVPLRGNLEAADQSFDLMGMALSNRFVSRNYAEKSKVKIDLEVMNDLMADRKLLVQKGGKQVLKTIRETLGVGDKEAAEIKDSIDGKGSNSLALLDSIMEDRLYGKHDMGGNEVLTKMVNTAIKWSAHNMLIGNYLSSMSNVLAGKTMNWFESTRGNWYDQKNLFNAELKYMKDLGNTVTDINSVQHVGKTNLFIDKFLDTSMDWSGMSNDLTQDTKIKRALSMSTLHGLNGSAEHYIQSTLMYATLDNIKVKNKKGEFVNAKGEVVASRDDAATMDELYKEVDGVLKWSDDNLTVEGFDEMNKNTEFAINRRIKDIAADLHGNYDANNKAMLQRYWYGKLAFYLRKWIVRGTQNRWRGIDNTDKAFDDMEESDKFYSEGSGDYKEGTYTSAVRFVRQNMAAMKSFQGEVLKLEWDKLTDMEKGNIKRVAYELGLMAATLAASAFLGKLALEDEDETDKALLYHAAYLMRRQAGELLAFTPVGAPEAFKTITTPTSVSSSVALAFKTTNQVLQDVWGVGTGGDFEVYQTGANKDKKKSAVLLMKLGVPGYKNATSTAQDKYKFIIRD